MSLTQGHVETWWSRYIWENLGENNGVGCKQLESLSKRVLYHCCITLEGITLEVWPLEFCIWTCPILICINIYGWPGKSPTPIAASLLSKCILLSYPFLFPVVVSGMKFSCCCSCQQHYLEINRTIACVYINREWRISEAQFTFVKMFPDAGMVNISVC